MANFDEAQSRSGDTFYDVHMHAFNLSHPYDLAFAKRSSLPLGLLVVGLTPLLGSVPVAGAGILARVNAVKNLLAVMENDIAASGKELKECTDSTKGGRYSKSINSPRSNVLPRLL